MTTPRYSDEDKLKEVDRELMQRHRVYRRLIERGKMSQEQASRQISIMSDIANDYRERVKTPLLSFRSS